MITKNGYTMDLECDGKHWIRPKLHAEGRNMTACRLAVKQAGWQFHKSGKVSCPKHATRRKPITAHKE